MAGGQSALAAGDAASADRRLGEALALWRGEPLADFAYERFAQGEIARLGQARLAALEDRIDARLALGEHARLVGELEALVREHPSRERLVGQLMVALYRSGRQADALESYRVARRRLVDELGLEPGRELQELERAILAQDPALDAPARDTARKLSATARRAAARWARDRCRCSGAARGADRSGGETGGLWHEQHRAGGAQLAGRDRHRYQPRRGAGRGRHATGRDRVRVGVAVGRKPRRPDDLARGPQDA